MTVEFASMCSGIEAASVAWESLGYEAKWFAEIEAFPSAVLAHRHPSVPNHGDMTKLVGRILSGVIPAPPVFVAGTPCQAFSVAGMREGLVDPRGALTIKYVEILDAADYIRIANGQGECVGVWENVPGVLSDKENAFGCFLGALVGESEELQPPGGKWKDAGCVYGPRRTVAWRVLDAQYFGLAQRRRRVFVVASARRGFDPAEVLFEREGMRRDHPPRRGEGQDVAGHAPFGPSLQCGCGHLFGMNQGAWGCPNCEGDEGPAVEVLAGVPAFGGENQSKSLFQAGALTAHGARNDFASETFCVAPTLRAQGNSSHRPDAEAYVAATLTASYGKNAGIPSGNDCMPLNLIAGTLQANGKAAGSATQQDAESGLLVPVCITGEITHTLKAEGFDASEDGTGRGQPIVAMHETGHGWWKQDDLAGTLRAEGENRPSRPSHVIGEAGAVRRLTPRECERLQGFPDDYTLIPWRGKPAEECPDGPRYKAIGNSKAIPVVRWIGRRLLEQLDRSA